MDQSQTRQGLWLSVSTLNIFSTVQSIFSVLLGTQNHQSTVLSLETMTHHSHFTLQPAWMGAEDPELMKQTKSHHLQTDNAEVPKLKTQSTLAAP